MISPPSDHPVTERNVAVVDSSINTVLIVDGQAGGPSSATYVVLHDRSDDDDVDKWLNPLSVATCDSCKHIFATSENILYVIDLDRPLKDMADDRDFSSL